MAFVRAGSEQLQLKNAALAELLRLQDDGRLVYGIMVLNALCFREILEPEAEACFSADLVEQARRAAPGMRDMPHRDDLARLL